MHSSDASVSVSVLVSVSVCARVSGCLGGCLCLFPLWSMSVVASDAVDVCVCVCRAMEPAGAEATTPPAHLRPRAAKEERLRWLEDPMAQLAGALNATALARRGALPVPGGCRWSVVGACSQGGDGMRRLCSASEIRLGLQVVGCIRGRLDIQPIRWGQHAAGPSSAKPECERSRLGFGRRLACVSSPNDVACERELRHGRPWGAGGAQHAGRIAHTRDQSQLALAVKRDMHHAL